MFFPAPPTSTPGKYQGRFRYERWHGEIDDTGLIRKEVCFDCRSTSPNITQTLSTPAKLSSRVVCHAWNRLSPLPLEVEVSRFSESLWRCGRQRRKKKSPVPFTFTGSEYSAITVKSTNLSHPLPTPHRWQAEAHLKAQKAPNAKESHQKFAEELLQWTKTQTSAGTPSI